MKSSSRVDLIIVYSELGEIFLVNLKKKRQNHKRISNAINKAGVVVEIRK